jgi:hypothetical protein
MAVIAAPATALWPVLAPFKMLNRKFARTPGTQDAEAVLTLDLERKYGPLQRLLAEEDLRFLEQCPGFHPEMLRRLRTDRLRISQNYLRSLAADFQLLQWAGRRIALGGGASREEMLEVLARREFSFYYRMAGAAASSLLFRCGWGHADLTSPLSVVRAMQADVQGWRKRLRQ